MVRNEAPYLEEWLEYHLGLGFDRVHLVSTDDAIDEIESFMARSRFASDIEPYHFDDFRPGWQVRCYNTCLPFIGEDWILVLDADEYLCLNGCGNIGDFLGALSVNVGQVQFPWLNVISDDYFHLRTFDVLNASRKYVSNHMKSLARRECISALGVHSHGIRDLANISSAGVGMPARSRHEFAFKNPEYYLRQPFVLHFASRGHFDVMNRIVGHRFFSVKNGSLEKRRLRDFLQGDPGWDNLPTRYLLSRIYRTMPRAHFDIALPVLESTTDVSLLSSGFAQIVGALVDVRGSDARSIARHFETTYALSRKLAGMELPQDRDHEEFLGCRTQVEYVERVRERLTPEARPGLLR